MKELFASYIARTSLRFRVPGVQVQVLMRVPKYTETMWSARAGHDAATDTSLALLLKADASGLCLLLGSPTRLKAQPNKLFSRRPKFTQTRSSRPKNASMQKAIGHSSPIVIP